MTRGTDTNLAFVFTTPARPADPQPGTRAAPELGRYERIRHERAGHPADEPSPDSPSGADPREPIAMLADVLGRDGAELSASAIRQQNLANADHLAILNTIWTAETQAARHDRYRRLVMATLPPGYRQDLSHQARWLFRTLHAAELAGLDPAEVIGTAIASRDLASAQDIAAVLDARVVALTSVNRQRSVHVERRHLPHLNPSRCVSCTNACTNQPPCLLVRAGQHDRPDLAHNRHGSI